MSSVVPGSTVSTVAAMMTALRSPSDILSMPKVGPEPLRATISTSSELSTETRSVLSARRSFSRVNGEATLAAFSAHLILLFSTYFVIERARLFAAATRSKRTAAWVSAPVWSIQREFWAVS